MVTTTNEIQAIAKFLNKAGYTTEIQGDVVVVYDPVYSSVVGSSQLVFSHYKEVKIKSSRAAWKFVDDRS